VIGLRSNTSNRKKSKHVSKVLGLGARERLGEKVCGHVLGRTINKLDRAIFDRVADEMSPDVDMLSLGMELPL
jgi:hypothetical protein